MIPNPKLKLPNEQLPMKRTGTTQKNRESAATLPRNIQL